MANQRIILVGGGGHCKSVISVINQLDSVEIVGILDNCLKPGTLVMGITVLGGDQEASTYIDDCEFIITIGQVHKSNLRSKVYCKYKDLGAKFGVVISTKAITDPSVNIGEGTVILNGAIVNAGSEIAENCIINSGALLEHDVKIGPHTHISTCAVINGEVSVGSNSMIGSNATVIQCIKIGEDVMVGAGSVVINDVPSKKIVVGNPLRTIHE